MNGEKLKVVWLCYFTNYEIQNQLKPYRRIGEEAPWISNLISIFERDDAVELHVISEHRWISCYHKFKKDGVTFHFINRGIPIIGRQWPGFFRFDFYTDNFFFRKKIWSIVNKIKPDIIHLHGAENEFCTSIIQFKDKYPVFITIQGFIHKSSAKDKITLKRIRKEYEILKMFNHFGYRTETMGRNIISLNPNSVLHWHNYPLGKIEPIIVEKKYDLVFFARICKDKGIEDLLKAVSIIKKEKPDISLCIIGGGNSTIYKKYVIELGINNNVFWAGFLQTQDDVHKLASLAKISVLPTYHDIISGTIIESLFLQLPVVAYNVGSIHEINKNNDIISLIEKGDIDRLAEEISSLLNNPEIRKKKSILGYNRVKEMFGINNEVHREDLLKAYVEVIRSFSK